MPMLYVVKMGGNFVQERTPPEDIVYVQPETIGELNEVLGRTLGEFGYEV